MMINTDEAFDPEWLVMLSQAKYPDIPALADALAKCKRIVSPVNTQIDIEADFYIRFRDFDPHKQSFCMSLEGSYYTIILDVVKEVDGIEIIGVEKLYNFSLTQCNKVLIVET